MTRNEPLRNALASQTSPYLLEHARDPVAWQPWGEPALARARTEDKPIFLSIGYSACHWCHVMQRESFASEHVARLLNEHFIPIKVDREERPDLDDIYMGAVRQLTGSGGWPLSVFLTPAGEPFHGGTYFPPVRSAGLPGFLEMLSGIARVWNGNRERFLREAGRIRATIAREAARDMRGALDPSVLDRSLGMLEERFDPRWGGFGDAPKFPRATDLRACLRHHLRTGKEAPLAMARLSLERMALGGIRDQIGGGFHRYSTDERWLVPHFEKMLCDNALLATAYVEGWLATGDPSFAETVRTTFEWVLREMRTSDGGFATSQDADSAGEEGGYYVWTPDELRRVLGARAASRAQAWWGIGETGSFDLNRSVPCREHPAREVAERLRVDPGTLESEMEEARRALFAERERRVRPGTDDKILAGWNGLMVSALALGAQVFAEKTWETAAAVALRLVLERMRSRDGRLLSSWRAGQARHPAPLADHAYVIQATIDMYETDFEPRWIHHALELSSLVSARYADEERGGFFDTADDHETLIARLSTPQDGALPSGEGVQILNLLRLAELTGRTELAREAERALLSRGAAINQYAAAFGQHLLAIDFLAAPPREIVLAGAHDAPELQAMLRAVRAAFLPQRVVALRRANVDPGPIALLEGREPGSAPARAWVCRHWSCREPIDDPAALGRELER